MEAGTARWHFEPLDLAELVRAVTDQFQRQSPSCRIDLSIDPAPCRMKGERDMLSLAVWNLLDNAVKYSPGRGTVWVSVSREADRAAIAVRDEGIGIPRDEQRRVFRKFVRGAGTHALGVRGCGIGLAIVDRVVRAHGGRVRLESEVGRGSTFTIVVPVIGDPIPDPRSLIPDP